MNKYCLALVGAALLGAPASGAAQDPMQVAEGATVWAQNCTRCHNARASTERTDRDWLTIVGHMRARANLTRDEASAVAAFLTATNEPPAITAATATGTAAETEVSAPETEGDTVQDARTDARRSNEPGLALSLEQKELLLRYFELLRPR